MNVKFRQYRGSVRLYMLGTLVAVELLMSFSFLGYVHIEPISITTAYIPVLLAGALAGPFESTVVGAVFGLASMWKASAYYVTAFDQLFSSVMSGSPVQSILLSVGSRALFGLLVGLLYLAFRNARHPAPWIALVSFFGPTIHSALVYSALWLFFPETGYTPASALKSLVTVKGLLSDLLAAVVVLLVWRLLRSRAWTQFVRRVDTVRAFRVGERYSALSLLCIIPVSLFSSVAVAIYFVNRMDLVLDQQGIFLSETERADLLHLQMQFLFGILAMMALVIVFLIFNRRYTAYIDREARMDALTGVLNRKAFFQSCDKALRSLDPGTRVWGYFIMIDMDRFKEVNDTCGHPEGDRVLKEAVSEIKATFPENRLIGRLGGDEFALLLNVPLSHAELEHVLRRLREHIHMIRWGDDQPMSCSIGVQPVTGIRNAEELYHAADELLYHAKELGRDQYAIGPAPDPDLAEGSEAVR